MEFLKVEQKVDLTAGRSDAQTDMRKVDYSVSLKVA